MDRFEKKIGENIRDVRQEKKLSQDALAKKCGFSNTTLSSYENSRKIPSLSTIAKIAKNLDVSIERLYYGDDNNAFIIMIIIMQAHIRQNSVRMTLVPEACIYF